VNEVVEKVAEEMTSTGKRDRRAELAKQAINTLTSGGDLRVIDGRLHFADGEA
jgi:hypothetical protein